MRIVNGSHDESTARCPGEVYLTLMPSYSAKPDTSSQTDAQLSPKPRGSETTISGFTSLNATRETPQIAPSVRNIFALNDITFAHLTLGFRRGGASAPTSPGTGG